MAIVSLIVFSLLSFALLAVFDMLVYQQTYLFSLKRLFLEDDYFNKSLWAMLLLALLLSAWFDLEKLPAGKRFMSRLFGKRKEPEWNRR